MPGAAAVACFDDVKQTNKHGRQKGAGKPYRATEWRNVRFYEGCLSEESRITTKDVFNRGHDRPPARNTARTHSRRGGSPGTTAEDSE